MPLQGQVRRTKECPNLEGSDLSKFWVVRAEAMAHPVRMQKQWAQTVPSIVFFLEKREGVRERARSGEEEEVIVGVKGTFPSVFLIGIVACFHCEGWELGGGEQSWRCRWENNWKKQTSVKTTHGQQRTRMGGRNVWQSHSVTQIGDSYYHQNRRFFEASISQMFTGMKIYHSCLLGLWQNLDYVLMEQLVGCFPLSLNCWDSIYWNH